MGDTFTHEQGGKQAVAALVLVLVTVLLFTTMARGADSPEGPHDHAVLAAITPEPRPTPHPAGCTVQVVDETGEPMAPVVSAKRGEDQLVSLQVADCDFERTALGQLQGVFVLPSAPNSPPPEYQRVAYVGAALSRFQLSYDGRIRPTDTGDDAWVPVTSFGETIQLRVSDSSSVAAAPLASQGWAVAAVHPADGELTTTTLPAAGGLPVWRSLGAGYMGAAVTELASGSVLLAAVDEDGQMTTWQSASWETDFPGAQTTHGQPTWDMADSPSLVALPGGGAMLAATKMDGRLYTREMDADGSWGAWKRHGALGWSRTELAVATSGELLLAGTKEDGRLYTWGRDTAGNWSGFIRHGKPTWDPLLAPALLATPDGQALLAATKTNGRLYTRWTQGGVWQQFERQGLADWAGVDVALAPDGTANLVAMKDDQRLYTRMNGGTAGTWEPWVRHRQVRWDPTEPPLISVDGQGELLVMGAAKTTYYSSLFSVKDPGLVQWRLGIDANWLPWQQHESEPG